MIEIILDDRVTQDLLKAAAAVPGAIERGLDRGAQIIENAAARQERRIASRPIPRSKKGRPLWQRTGALAASRATERAPGSRVIGWKAIYAARRFGLGYAWTPRNPALGIVRRNNVPLDTARIIEPQIRILIDLVYLGDLREDSKHLFAT